MHTALGAILYWNLEMDVVPHYDKIKEKEDLFLHECTKIVLYRKEKRAGMLSLCTKPHCLLAEEIFKAIEVKGCHPEKKTD